MRGRAGPIILAKLRQILSEILRAELAATGKRTAATRQSEVAVQFIVGAYISIVTWWLDRGGRESPAEIDRAFRQLAMGSLRTMFSASSGAKA